MASMEEDEQWSVCRFYFGVVIFSPSSSCFNEGSGFLLVFLCSSAVLNSLLLRDLHLECMEIQVSERHGKTCLNRSQLKLRP